MSAWLTDYGKAAFIKMDFIRRLAENRFITG